MKGPARASPFQAAKQVRVVNRTTTKKQPQTFAQGATKNGARGPTRTADQVQIHRTTIKDTAQQFSQGYDIPDYESVGELLSQSNETGNTVAGGFCMDGLSKEKVQMGGTPCPFLLN